MDFLLIVIQRPSFNIKFKELQKTGSSSPIYIFFLIFQVYSQEHVMHILLLFSCSFKSFIGVEFILNQER